MHEKKIVQKKYMENRSKYRTPIEYLISYFFARTKKSSFELGPLTGAEGTDCERELEKRDELRRRS